MSTAVMPGCSVQGWAEIPGADTCSVTSTEMSWVAAASPSDDVAQSRSLSGASLNQPSRFDARQRKLSELCHRVVMQFSKTKDQKLFECWYCTWANHCLSGTLAKCTG